MLEEHYDGRKTPIDYNIIKNKKEAFTAYGHQTIILEDKDIELLLSGKMLNFGVFDDEYALTLKFNKNKTGG